MELQPRHRNRSQRGGVPVRATAMEGRHPYEVPSMRRPTPLLIGLAIAAFGAAACSGGGVTPPPTTAAATTPAVTTGPATSAPATQAPSAAAADVTVEATAVGNAGTILVDGASGMTLYLFTKDTKDSGKSVCTEQCLVTWPALTVDAGATPTGGPGVDATKLGTITR